MLLRYGQFLNTVVSFLLLSLAVFWLVKAVARLLPPPALPPPSQTKECAFCSMAVPEKARRCPLCTSELG